MPNKDKEGLPTCFVESMSLGVPCVGTNYSGIPELIDHEVNGMLSKEKDVQDITSKMCKLYEMIKNDNAGSISESCKLKASSMFNNEENINLLLEYLK
jgi:glycosyltransferase involved in cell wall biosynthesis